MIHTQPRTLQWCHNERDGNDESNHQCLVCLLNCLFRCRSKKTWELQVISHSEGNAPVISSFPHKGPVMWKMFPFDDVIMRKVGCYFFSTQNMVLMMVERFMIYPVTSSECINTPHVTNSQCLHWYFMAVVILWSLKDLGWPWLMILYPM